MTDRVLLPSDLWPDAEEIHLVYFLARHVIRYANIGVVYRDPDLDPHTPRRVA